MKTISIETALEEIRAELRSAGPRHSCDPDPIAAAYSVLCAGHDEEVMVVTGDKSGSRVFVNGRTDESDEGCIFLSHGSSEPAPAEFAGVVWTVEDIKDRMPEWSDERCRKFLDDNEDSIQQEMIEAAGCLIKARLPRE